jgi:Lrp/AsnC family leucine-responsive transcriptional regulator
MARVMTAVYFAFYGCFYLFSGVNWGYHPSIDLNAEISMATRSPRPVRARDLDRIDRHILRILQQEGRISFTELGERVGLSTTPCTERVRRLERDGVVEGYYARLNPQHLKAGLLVFVEISLAYKSGDIFEEFRRAALKLPNVMECHLMSGDFDYLIKARISEMASYRKLLGSSLLTLPHVRESKSYIVMEEVKETLALAIPD